jgi:hypothetical protein
MSLMQRLFRLKQAENNQDIAEQTNDAHVGAGENLVTDDAAFDAYLEQLAASQQRDKGGFSDDELLALHDAWQKNKVNGSDDKALLMVGVGVIAAVGLFPGRAHASIGDEIGKKIVEHIGPFVMNLANTVMSTLGMDIQNGADKQAAAAGKGVDAQNEVLRTIYNKEAARAAVPAPGQCVSEEIAKQVVQSEAQTEERVSDYISYDNGNNVHILTTIHRSADRIKLKRDAARATALRAEGVSENAPPQVQVAALVKNAGDTSYATKKNLTKEEADKAKAHVGQLFGDTVPGNDIGVEPDTPVNKHIMQRKLEAAATLAHCQTVFARDIEERTSVSGAPSAREVISLKVRSEYGSEAFAQELSSITHPAPALKTLIEQQAFSNLMATKHYEQQAEMVKLLALQLKEMVRNNMKA